MPRSVDDGDGILHPKLSKVLTKHLLKGEVVHFEAIHEFFIPSVHLSCLITAQMPPD